jgi:hypothetical protein
MLDIVHTHSLTHLGFASKFARTVRHYTDRMDEDLRDALVHLTFLAASDGKRGIYIDRLAGVSRMFLAALHGIAEAKMSVVDLPSRGHVASEGTDYNTPIRSFLAICD